MTDYQEEEDQPESAPRHKKFRGKKITLAKADTLFAEFMQRVHTVNADPEYGAEIAAVIVFGSYLRREPEVTDIDMVLLEKRRPNYKERNKIIDSRYMGRRSFVDYLYGASNEVKRALMVRNGRLSIHHDLEELISLGDCPYAIAWCSPDCKALVDTLVFDESVPKKERYSICMDVRRALNVLSCGTLSGMETKSATNAPTTGSGNEHISIRLEGDIQSQHVDALVRDGRQSSSAQSSTQSGTLTNPTQEAFWNICRNALQQAGVLSKYGITLQPYNQQDSERTRSTQAGGTGGSK